MIYFILILFFASLFSIIFMIGRKLALVKNGNIEVSEGASFEIPYLKEAAQISIENIKKYEHEVLVVVVKFYVQFSGFLKNKYQELKTKVQNVHIKHYPNGELKEKIESSKFLKLISDYKHKIKEIRHKIKEEENNS